MSKPKMLDLFCGAGGAGRGYMDAGFDVTGVDIEHHPDYPSQMLTKDAMSVLADVGYLDTFDAIHASPPCQSSTTMSNRWRGKGGKTDAHVNLIPDVRNFLSNWGGVWVIENVPGARKSMDSPVIYSGGAFGLKVDRPRLFESSVKTALNVSEQMVDRWANTRGLIAEIAATQNPDLCFVCQERTYFTKVSGVGICRRCDL